jgi:prevent-host-death family protein
MQIPIPDAKAHLSELVRRAENGDEIILTRHGHAAVRLVPVKAPLDGKSRRAVLEAARKAGAAKAKAGPGAARSRDFLYGDDGLTPPPQPSSACGLAGEGMEGASALTAIVLDEPEADACIAAVL